MKHKRSLYNSIKLQEKQIDKEIYVEEFNIHIYIYILWRNIYLFKNSSKLSIFYIYDMKYFVDSPNFCMLYVDHIVAEQSWMDFS